jgi:predicted secreted protein
MGTPISGKGTLFRRWNDNPAGSSVGLWETIAQVKSIDGPSASRETLDTTTLDTPGGYRTFIASLREAGEISLTMNFTRETYELMKNDFEDDALKNYEIIFPDAENTTFEFEGLVTEVPITVEVDSIVTSDVTIKISGQVTVNSGSGSGS